MRSLRSTFALFLFALIAAIPVAAAEGVVTSSLMVPVDGLVFNPGGTLEGVALTGRVHLVTRVQPGEPCQRSDPCHVYVNLADVKGIGLSSGALYVAIGAASPPFATPMPPPILPQFVIMPVSTPPNPITPPNPVLPITFVVTLAFDQAGTLSPGATTVGLPACSLDFGCQ